MMRVLAALMPLAAALHPRPSRDHPESLARWLLHESDYGVLSTACADPLGWNAGCAYPGGHITDVASVADGNGTEHSDGVPRFLIPLMDHTGRNLKKDNRISITFSEMPLGTCPKNGPGSTAEDPLCARLTLGGTLSRIENKSNPQYAISMAYLMARHPSMKAWMKKGDHDFAPYVMTMHSICFLYEYGGSYNMSISDFLAAPAWPPSEVVV